MAQCPTSQLVASIILVQAKGGYNAASYGFQEQQDEPQPETESEEEVGWPTAVGSGPPPPPALTPWSSSRLCRALLAACTACQQLVAVCA